MLKLIGELTMLTASRFDQVVTSELAVLDQTDVLLDVSELKFIDSSGLGALARLVQQIKLQDGAVHLAGMRANLLELIYISRLEREFKWYKSAAEAVAALRPETSAGSTELQRPSGPTGLIEYQQSWIPELPRAETTRHDLSKYHHLPEYEHCVNYPTWYVLQWFRSRQQMRQDALKIIQEATSDVEAGNGLHRMVIHEHREVIHQRTLVNGMFGFAMRYVDWEEVAAQIKRVADND